MEKARINPIIAEYEAKKAEEKKQRELERQKEIERMRVNGEALEEYLVNGVKPVLDAAVTDLLGAGFQASVDVSYGKDRKHDGNKEYVVGVIPKTSSGNEPYQTNKDRSLEYSGVYGKASYSIKVDADSEVPKTEGPLPFIDSPGDSVSHRVESFLLAGGIISLVDELCVSN